MSITALTALYRALPDRPVFHVRLYAVGQTCQALGTLEVHVDAFDDLRALLPAVTFEACAFLPEPGGDDEITRSRDHQIGAILTTRVARDSTPPAPWVSRAKEFQHSAWLWRAYRTGRAAAAGDVNPYHAARPRMREAWQAGLEDQQREAACRTATS